MKKNIKIGIIGGMGPFASAHFLKLLLQKISEQNIKMPEIILDSVSIEDFISDQTRLKPALIILKDRVKKLNKLGVNLIVMTCNTAHIFHSQLSVISQANFPSLIDLVINEAKKNKLKRIGLLATPTTIKTNLYTNKFISSKNKLFLPDKRLQSLIEKLIKKAVISDTLSSDIDKLVLKIKKFINTNQLDGLILGCTELPLIFPNPKLFKITVLNCLDILADSIIDYLFFKSRPVKGGARRAEGLFSPFCQRGMPRVYERKGI